MPFYQMSSFLPQGHHKDGFGPLFFSCSTLMIVKVSMLGVQFPCRFNELDHGQAVSENFVVPAATGCINVAFPPTILDPTQLGLDTSASFQEVSSSYSLLIPSILKIKQMQVVR